jgi:60 kDa SS-A/Ro ribonucleoprotein
VKRAINNWLVNNKGQGLSEYHAIKYGGGEGKQKWTLKDIIKMAHPMPKDKAQSALFNYLTKGTLELSLNQITAIESLKKLAAAKKEISADEFAKNAMRLIEEGRLPYEVVTGIIKPDAQIWEYLMKQMPIFATVRHLNTLDQAGVFAKPENIKWVTEKLTNADVIKNSKMLPFRFSTAYKMFKGHRNISAALETALDLSLCNLKLIPGRTAWFLDVSGSMTGDYLEIGALLGIAGLKRSPESIFLCFDHQLKYPRLNPDRSVMSNMQEVMRMRNGSTDVGMCVQYLQGQVTGTASRYSFSGGYAEDFPASEKATSPVVVDNIIIITDEQQNSGKPVVQRFREYRRDVNPNARLFVIDLAPYNNRVANQDETGVTFIYGWNDTVLDILQYAIEGTGSHVDQIKNMRLA